ncbi:MAG: DUF2975 domain-containing protein [Asticcacaulis sp.]|nr:DUF2975 domain-containing protein [Asticcacaulis sp.]
MSLDRNGSSTGRTSSLSFSAVATRLRDPLLVVTHVASLLGMAGLAALAVIALGTSLLVWLIRAKMSAAMAGIPYVDAARMPFLMSMNLLLVAAMAVAGFLFLKLLRRLVTSVAEGNPFGTDNARRLNFMAWLTVAANILAMFVGGYGVWFAVLTHVQNPGYAATPSSFAFNPIGWLLTLVLFVLARVFGQGASMRDDLEGTV